jgi:hypothetical protein
MPRVTPLEGYGYISIGLPNEDDKPFKIIRNPKGGLKRMLYREGNLPTFLSKDSPPLPNITKDSTVTDIKTTKTVELEADVGIDLLKSILKASKVDPFEGELQVAFQNVKKFEFEYRNPKRDFIEPADVIDYLENCNPTHKEALLERMDQNNEAFIVTEVLKSNNFSIIAKDESGTVLDLDTSILENLFSGGGKIAIKKDENNNLAFQGDQYFAVGLKAHEIRRNKKRNKLELKEPLKRGTLK